jgi:hypothetical protein
VSRIISPFAKVAICYDRSLRWEKDQMPTRWIYDTAGKPAYYQEGKNIYAAPTGACEFCKNGGWWYQMKSGVAAYYVENDQVFTPDGEPAFHYA